MYAWVEWVGVMVIGVISNGLILRFIIVGCKAF